MQRVYINKEFVDVTNLGQAVFSDNNVLAIFIPLDRLIDYKTAPNWEFYSSSIINRGVSESGLNYCFDIMVIAIIKVFLFNKA